jgi:DNA-binding transcriptional regulator GbsR (MarR family)
MEDKKIKRSKNQLELVERFGLTIQRSGLQPAVARVYALLMVSDVIELTFEQIGETLQLSKSATSNAINLLLQLKRIDFITKPGDRKRYFKIKSAGWRAECEEEFKNLADMRLIMQEILNQRPKTTPKFNEKLAEVIDMFEFINNRIPPLFEEWEKEYTKKIAKTQKHK